MPDHIHFLCEGLSDNSDLVQFVDALKQRTASTAYGFKKTHGQRLWQMRYYDHILRPSESPDAVGWYIWMNPVRKGFCSQPDRYPHSGSFTGQWENMSRPEIEWVPAWKMTLSVSRSG